jgi:hypothetical protein
LRERLSSLKVADSTFRLNLFFAVFSAVFLTALARAGAERARLRMPVRVAALGLSTVCA